MNRVQEFRAEFGLIVVGAIIFLVSMLWKDLLMEIGNRYFPKRKGLTNRVLYVLIITVVLVICIIQLRHWFLIALNRTITFDAGALPGVNR